MDKQLDDSACLFLFDFLGGAVAWPLATQAQQQERMRRIGVLGLARGRRLEVDDQLVLGRPCTGRSAGFSPLRMRSTFTDAEIVEPAPGKPNEDLRPRKLTAVEMTSSARSRKRSASRSPCFASSIMRLATVKVTGSSRSFSCSSSKAPSNAVTRTSISPGPNERSPSRKRRMGMDTPLKPEPRSMLILFTLSASAKSYRRRRPNSGDCFKIERGYRARERALNLSGASNTLDVCPHLEHW